MVSNGEEKSTTSASDTEIDKWNLRMTMHLHIQVILIKTSEGVAESEDVEGKKLKPNK